MIWVLLCRPAEQTGLPTASSRASIRQGPLEGEPLAGRVEKLREALSEFRKAADKLGEGETAEK